MEINMVDTIKKSGVDEQIDKRVGGGIYEKLDKRVKKLIERAEERADAAGRKTVKARDI